MRTSLLECFRRKEFFTSTSTGLESISALMLTGMCAAEVSMTASPLSRAEERASRRPLVGVTPRGNKTLSLLAAISVLITGEGAI